MTLLHAIPFLTLSIFNITFTYCNYLFIMSSNSSNDKHPKPGEKYSYEGFTFYIPPPNFVLPDYFVSNRNDGDRVNTKQSSKNIEDEKNDSVNCTSNNVIENVSCDFYSSLSFYFRIHALVLNLCLLPQK